MAALGSQSIASSYEQLLHVDADGGGNGTTHVSVKDGDNGTTFGFTIASDALMMTSTNRLEFGDNGTYIHQSADGVLDLVSDSEIELNGTIDINGAVTMDGGNVTINDDSGDYDFRVESNGNANMLFVDGGNDGVGISTNNPQSNLDLGNASGGTGIAWGGTTGTAHYTTIWSEYGTGSLIVGAGLKGSTSASTFLNPHTGTYGYAAMELDSFSSDGIKFYVGSSSSKTKDDSITPSEAMRIDQSGNVNITGLTASSDVQTDGSKNLISTSDSRLKNDLGLIDDGLSVIKELTPHYFSWKSDETGSKQLGFFAQETHEILPEAAPKSEKMNLVSPAIEATDEGEAQEAVYERALDDEGNPDWNWGFNGRPIIAMLVKAVQELSAKVEALEG